MTDIRTLEERRDQAQSQFAALGDLRPGTLSETASKCGKPNCRCAREGDPGHPGHILRRSLNGRQKSVRIRDYEAEETRAQIDEYRHFKALSQEFLDLLFSASSPVKPNRTSAVASWANTHTRRHGLVVDRRLSAHGSSQHGSY